MINNLLDFSKLENSNSKFTAELQKRGGNITFSNSGKGGDKKYFNLSLETFLSCLKDMRDNISEFQGHENYVEKEWRDLGSRFFKDGPANAQITVQTKPMFITLSKIIMWANSQSLNDLDPEKKINLEATFLDQAITALDELTNKFNPFHNNKIETDRSIKNNIEEPVLSSNSIRDFALLVFKYFYNDKWDNLLNESQIKDATINKRKYKVYDHEWFKNLIGVFGSLQDKTALTSSKTIRYFEDPIFSKEGNYYYFSTQWNATGEYNLSFRNLKNFIENRFPNYSAVREGEIFKLISIRNNHSEILQDLFNISTFKTDCDNSGLIYSNQLITQFLSSLITKPFVILTGLSGSGKTRLAQAFVQWICQDESQYRIIPVGADWTNREPLLGYPNALNTKDYVKPDNGVIDLMIEAKDNPLLPYFLVLDEMNLSHVERYFADFLSVMESNEDIPLHDGGKNGDETKNGVPSKLILPSNLFIIGTVNIDETTNMFSPKVLDRANTIEFRIGYGEMRDFLNEMKELNMDALEYKGANMAEDFIKLSNNKSFATEDVEAINNTLLQFFAELKKTGAEFGYRTATEIMRLIHQLTELEQNKDAKDRMSTNEKIDIAIMQKLLPKLHGSRRKLSPILETLGGFCLQDKGNVVKDVFENENFEYYKREVKPLKPADGVLYPLSLEKISRMYNGAIDNGFTSFAEA